MTNAAADIHQLLQKVKTASLATQDAEWGGPYVSLVNLALDEQGLPIFLFSKLARHTQSLLKNPQASVLAADVPEQGDVLTGLRATLMGRMTEMPDKALAKTYCAQHPAAEAYCGFADFSFWRLAPEKIHVIAGFGRIQTLPASAVFPGFGS